MNVPTSSQEGSTLLGVLALLATLAVVALIALQVMEYLHYGADPSVWPS
jgi:hypothetical protein